MCDLGVVAAAWGAAYLLRFSTSLLPPAPAAPNPQTYLLLGAGMLPLWHLLLRQRGLYEARRGRSWLVETRVLLEVSVLATLVLAATTFFWKTGVVSRGVVALFAPLAAGGLVLFRASLRGALAGIRRRGYNQRSVLIVGTGVLAAAVYERLQHHPETGLWVEGFLGPPLAPVGRRAAPVLGDYNDIRQVVATRGIDQVLLALDRTEMADPMKLLHEIRDTTAGVRIILDLNGLHTLQAGIEDFDGLPALRLIESPLVGWNRVLKRSVDLAVSGIGLLLSAPLMVAIALAIRLTSPDGPVLYRQERMGLDGRLFTMLKFRTMIPDAEAKTGPTWAEPNDARRTRLGAGLRRLNLDELPQLWNVLRGEMSLVGPRPERPEFIRDFRARIPGYMLRHKVKAGLTGWAQVHGFRGNTSVEKRLEYDIEYIRRWSLGLDAKILVLTLLRSFRDPNAY